MTERMPWFKWWIGTAADPKLRMLAEGANLSVATVLGVWAYLLEQAGKSEPRGVIAWESLDVELMAYTLRIPLETVETVCNGLKRARIVTETGEIPKWEERQAKRENQEPSGASTKRVQAFRERQKALNGGDSGEGNGGNGGNDPKRHETTGNDTKRPKKKIREEGDKKPKTSSSAGADGFADFWEAYPRKQGKQAAVKAWAKLKATPELLATILAAVAAQRESWDWTKDDGAYIQHPATWLNGGRWLDEVRKAPPAKPGITQWWTSEDKMRLKGQEFDPPLTFRPGETKEQFQARLIAAIEARDRGELKAQPLAYVPPEPAGGEDNLTPDQRRERMAELKAALKQQKAA